MPKGRQFGSSKNFPLLLDFSRAIFGEVAGMAISGTEDTLVPLCGAIGRADPWHIGSASSYCHAPFLLEVRSSKIKTYIGHEILCVQFYLSISSKQDLI